MSRRSFIALSVVLDALVVNGAFMFAFFVRFGGFPAFNLRPYLILAPLITLAYVASGYVNGIYEPQRIESIWNLVRGVSLAASLGTLLTLATLYVAGPAFSAFPRTVLAFVWPLQIVVLVGWRLVFLRVSSVAFPEQHVLIVGSGALAIDLARELKARAGWGFRVAGLVEPHHRQACEPPSEREGFPVLGCLEDIAELACRHDVNRVIVTSPIALRELVESLALADEADVRIDVVPELYEIFIGSVDAIVGDVPLMQITHSTVPPYQRTVKRTLDVVASVVLLVILSPVLLFAAIAVLVTSGSPVVFHQERVGKGMRTFDVYKFRTMVKDAEKVSGPVLATDDDPRITPVGRTLRRFRIDELPQLLNILRGEMSFVGPRPERPYFVERFQREIPGYRERFNVKPGVTGLAQVSGGYATTPERKLKYDLIYMYHQDLTMDARIIIETLQVVLTGKGAR